jgi:hypothetical protein
MNLDQLPINGFDFVLILVLAAGIAKGRKRGMSEELLSLLTWLAILVGCSYMYEPGGKLLARNTTVFGPLSCYLIAYVAGALLVMLVFAGVKRGLGGKLVGSDIFGRSEYYLGMGAGVVRYCCVLLVGLALLNARYFNPMEVRAMEKRDIDIYGSTFFPGLHSLQSTVFDKSLTGPWIKQNLGNLLIKPTEPDKREFHQRDAVLP